MCNLLIHRPIPLLDILCEGKRCDPERHFTCCIDAGLGSTVGQLAAVLEDDEAVQELFEAADQELTGGVEEQLTGGVVDSAWASSDPADAEVRPLALWRSLFVIFQTVVEVKSPMPNHTLHRRSVRVVCLVDYSTCCLEEARIIQICRVF